MLSTFRHRLRAAVTSAVGRAKSAFREATRPLPLVAGFAVDLTRSRRELIAENVLLRQQLIVASRKVKRPAFRSQERGLLVLLAGLVPRWRDAVLLVKPDTILRWHREGFRLFWRYKSRGPNKPCPRLSAALIELIRSMAESNVTWGAERIRGELLKLGIRIAKRTIQKYMRGVRPPAPPRGQRWHTFLRNHTVWAPDLLQTYDIWFTAPSALPRCARAVGLRATRPLRGLRALRHRPIFAFFIIDINTKRVVSVGVTRSPSETWTAQQLRNATPFGRGPQFIIRDRDDKFTAPAALPRSARTVALRATRPLRGLRALRVGAEFDRVAKGVGIRVIRTAVKAPLMNSVCERYLGSVRREALDHVIVLGERHMKRVLGEYTFRYHNASRPHQGLSQSIPVSTPRRSCSDASRVVAIPVLGGLHHDYRAAA